MCPLMPIDPNYSFTLWNSIHVFASSCVHSISGMIWIFCAVMTAASWGFCRQLAIYTWIWGRFDASLCEHFTVMYSLRKLVNSRLFIITLVSFLQFGTGNPEAISYVWHPCSSQSFFSFERHIIISSKTHQSVYFQSMILYKRWSR